MKRFFFSDKGQSITEYATLIAIVVGVAVAVKLFVQRGIQARQYDAARMYLNAVGVNVSDEASMQAEMYYTQSTTASSSASDSSKSFNSSGTARYVSSQRVTASGSEATLSANDYNTYSSIYN